MQHLMKYLRHEAKMEKCILMLINGVVLGDWG